MDLSPQRVLKALPKSRERAVTVDRLAEALGLSETQTARLREYLKEFARTGLAATKNHRYWRKSLEGMLIGTLRGTRSGHAFVVPVTLDSIPVFVRGGSILFRQPVVQHTGEMAGQTLRLLVPAAEAAEGTEYEDDGHTLAHLRGASLRRRFSARRDGGRWTLQAAAAEGSYRPPPRDLEVDVRGMAEPGSVSLGAETLARLAPEALAGAAAGWSRTPEGDVVIKVRDRFEPFAITLTR